MAIEKIKVESQEELEQMMTNEITQIEKDLTIICSNIPINDKTNLDILCHDGNGQLVIVQLNVSEDDIMLLQGIQSLDYVDKFKNFIKATYSKNKIDVQQKPRLILIAPSFSDAVRKAVESMQGIRVDLYEWEYLKLGDHKGFRLQPLFEVPSQEKPKEEKTTEKKREHKTPKKKEQADSEPLPAEDTLAEASPTEFGPKKEEPYENVDTYTPKEKEEPKKKHSFF
ncbi:MAG: endonuclease NucS [Candidatus Bathyarchaeia archaeon]